MTQDRQRLRYASSDLKRKQVNTGGNWWNMYQAGGLEELLQPFEAWHSSPLDELEEFWKRLDGAGFSQIKEAQAWLKQEFDLAYDEDSLGNDFRRHGIKCKIGGPHHPNKEEAKRTTYKKNMLPN